MTGIALNLVCIGLAALCSAAPTTAHTETPSTEAERVLYALGLAMAGSAKNHRLSASELVWVQRGLADGVSGKPLFTLAPYLPKIHELSKQRIAEVAAQQRKTGSAFLSRAATEPGAVLTKSGMVITQTVEGTGAAPTSSDTVTFHQQGSLVDGRVFDSTRTAGKPITMRVQDMFLCGKEGLPTMKVGGKSRFVCPPELAFGDTPGPGEIPPGATLVIEVELIDIVR